MTANTTTLNKSLQQDDITKAVVMTISLDLRTKTDVLVASWNEFAVFNSGSRHVLKSCSREALHFNLIDIHKAHPLS